jgi:hypothetical protein
MNRAETIIICLETECNELKSLLRESLEVIKNNCTVYCTAPYIGLNNKHKCQVCPDTLLERRIMDALGIVDNLEYWTNSR